MRSSCTTHGGVPKIKSIQEEVVKEFFFQMKFSKDKSPRTKSVAFLY